MLSINHPKLFQNIIKNYIKLALIQKAHVSNEYGELYPVFIDGQRKAYLQQVTIVNNNNNTFELL